MTDRYLVRLHWPAELRPAFDALFAIDDAMGDVVMSSTQPALGAIRLAWWREALERLDTSPPPPEPRLQDVAVELLPRGITGMMLAGQEQGWAALLDEQPDFERVQERGAIMFRLAARLLGAEDPCLDPAGRLFAFVQIKRMGMVSMPMPSQEIQKLARHRFHRTLRPLTALARLAARDFNQMPLLEPEATPGRAAALLSHRLFGRVA